MMMASLREKPMKNLHTPVRELDPFRGSALRAGRRPARRLERLDSAGAARCRHAGRLSDPEELGRRAGQHPGRAKRPLPDRDRAPDRHRERRLAHARAQSSRNRTGRGGQVRPGRPASDAHAAASRRCCPGDRIEITFLLSDGQRVPAIFDVQGQDATGGARTNTITREDRCIAFPDCLNARPIDDRSP